MSKSENTHFYATHLAKHYDGRAVVKNVSLKIEPGEIVGLLGPNGAGKTTSFYMLVGLVPSDHGRVYFDATDITDLPFDARARMGIGYLPQEASIFTKLTVEENLMAVLQLRSDVTDNERYTIIDRLLLEFNVSELRHQLGQSLSGGERRRVEIARALACNPKFILLDEPFAGVDPISVADIKKIILHLRKRGIGVLITDHNVRETLDICERAYIVSSGSIICEGTPTEILSNEQVRAVYLGEDFDL